MNHPNRARIKDLASYIRRFRERYDLTQPDLAELLSAGQENSVSVSTVQRWEYRKRTPPPYLRLALAQIAAKLSRETGEGDGIRQATEPGEDG
ncbi:MAG TPA: helix-turn-helix domain-containing protein [Terriglobia bacterium]|nr:helix-turn-helix domain-containing protein [Terriglobia bacterium]HTW80615.1 helix-turn-helix domain-containing protein [Terracidiphilus sp.]